MKDFPSVIFLTDGTPFYMFGEGENCRKEAFLTLLREKLGEDAVSYFNLLMEDSAEELARSKSEAHTNELASDGWYQMVLNTRNELSEAMTLFNAKPFNKKRCREIVESVYNDLYSNT